jgi:hypothetical protein
MPIIIMKADIAGKERRVVDIEELLKEMTDIEEQFADINETIKYESVWIAMKDVLKKETQ